MRAITRISNISITNKRKVKVFLFILVLTSIIWLLIELSKSYTSSAVFTVEYENLPTGKLLESKPVSEIQLALKAPGFSLLKYKVKKHKLRLSLRNVTKKNSRYYLLLNKQLTYLSAQLSSENEIIRALKDTIFIELGNNRSKKVPINPSLDLKFKLGYNLTEPLKITPDSVLITGPQKLVDSIKEIKTSVLKINNAYENISSNVDLILPLEKDNLIVSATKVNISGLVDKFTEGKLTIPVIIINKPEGVKINTFPKEVQVIYQAGLSNFNKITKNSFLVVYDFEQYKKDTLIKYLTPIIKHKSEFISSIKLNPSQIEFLIQN